MTLPRRILIFGAAAAAISNRALAGSTSPMSSAAQSVSCDLSHRWLCDVSQLKGVDPSGANDSTAALRAAANAMPDDGGVLIFPPGRYRISDSVLLPTGTHVYSPGDATVFTREMRGVAEVVHPREKFRGAAFGNRHFTAKNIQDKNISIENMKFDWGDVNGSSSHILRFISCKNIRVTGCSFQGDSYGDAVAFIGCDGIIVDSCRAKGFVNAALDTWDGCRHIRFFNNNLKTGENCNQVINVNGVSDYGAPNTADSFVVAGNFIDLHGSKATAIYLATLGAGSEVANGRIVGNTIVGDPDKGGYGIIARGLGGRFVVAENQITDIGPAPNILIDTAYFKNKKPEYSTDCSVIDNIIVNPRITTGPFDGEGAAVIALTGDHHYCAGNRIVGGSYPWLIWTNSDTDVLGPNFGPSGSKGRYGDDGYHHAMVLDADTASGTWRVTGGVTIDGNVVVPNLPTSPARLPKGALWNNHGTVSVSP